MIREMSLTVALLFLTSGVLLTNAQADGPLIEPAVVDVVYFERNLTLRCADTPDKTLTYTWTKNGKPLDEVEELKKRAELAEGGAVLSLRPKLSEDDFGNYSCAAGAGLRHWDVRAKPTARLPADSNVVENQNLKLTCKVTGKPRPRVWWTYRASPDSNASLVLEQGARDGRVSLSAAGAEGEAVQGAVLELRAAERGDAGEYACHAAAGDHEAAATTTLRVKDMYAALWPFLGICAEVFVLCAIILVYEKRRTKPELDDSDTDNHDQKKS